MSKESCTGNVSELVTSVAHKELALYGHVWNTGTPDGLRSFENVIWQYDNQGDRAIVKTQRRGQDALYACDPDSLPIFKIANEAARTICMT